MVVAWILIALNNKNSESVIRRWKREIREAEQSATRELCFALFCFYLYRILRLKGWSYLYESLDCISRLLAQTDHFRLLSQTALSSCLFSPYIPRSAQPYHFCFHLPSAGIKVVWLQVLGSPLCELCFSFRLSISCSPGRPWTHRDPSASVSWVLGLNMCATTAWPLMA